MSVLKMEHEFEHMIRVRNSTECLQVIVIWCIVAPSISVSVYIFHHLKEFVKFIQLNCNGTYFKSCSLIHRIALS
jgi:hypothetical protein